MKYRRVHRAAPASVIRPALIFRGCLATGHKARPWQLVHIVKGHAAMTDKVDIEQIEELLAKATPGVVESSQDCVGIGGQLVACFMGDKALTEQELFIALRNAAPALLAAYKAMQWKPIETAPKDVDRILVFVPSYDPSMAHWATVESKWVCHSILNRYAQPTHWLPLPTPPEASDE